MKEQVKAPSLRFKEFEGTEGWEERILGDYLSEAFCEKDTDVRREKIITVRMHRKGAVESTTTAAIKEGSTTYYKRRAGQLIYGKQGFYMGALAIIPKELDGNLSTADLPTLDINTENIDSKYLIEYIGRGVYYKNKEKYAQGTSSKRIHEKTLKSFKIMVPSPAEQKKIGNFFSLLDQNITNQAKKVDALKTYKEGLLQRVFDRELRFKDANGEDYPEWEEVRLGDVLQETVDNRGRTPKIVSYGIPLIEINAVGGYEPNYSKVSKYVTEEEYTTFFRKHLKTGDILFSTVGTTCLTSYYTEEVKACIAQNIIGLRTTLNSRYFKYSLDYNKRNIRAIEMGATQPSVNVTQLKRVSLEIVTDCEEQKKIGDFFSKLDKKIEIEQRKLEAQKQEKKALMQRMFI